MDNYSLMFEGVDCVGKSSIIKEFNKNREFEVRITQRPLNLQDSKKIYKNLVDRIEKGHYLFDRGFISELVYAPKYRDYEPDFIEDLMARTRNNVIYVFVDADLEVVKSRFDFDFIDIDDIKGLQQSFYLASDFEWINFINIDTTNRTVEESSELLRKRLEENYGITDL